MVLEAGLEFELPKERGIGIRREADAADRRAEIEQPLAEP